MASPALRAAPTVLTQNLVKQSSSCRFSINRSFCLDFSNGFSNLFSRKLSVVGQKPVIVSAKKDGKKSKKPDYHSFVPRPDEATGLFPESILLKEKKVQDDGKLLPEFADDEERELFEALNLEFESDLNVEQMRHYEVVFLIHENYAQEVESITMKVQEFIREAKGRVWRFSDWGMRRLAYKIQKAKYAHYILMNFEMEAGSINDFKSMLDKDERVIRHLVMKRDKAETEECPPPPEFYTLRAGIDVDSEDDVDSQYEDEYDDDGWDNEGETDGSAANYDDGMDDGIIYVDDGIEKSVPKNTGIKQKRIHRAEKSIR